VKNTPFVPEDIVILPPPSPRNHKGWIAVNVFAKTSLGISGKVIELLENLDDMIDHEETYICWDIEYFSNENGLLTDPSRFRRGFEEWVELKLNHAELLAKLKKHFILLDDEQAYHSRFTAKKHLLDYKHFGNFHQQHGQHMRVKRRIDPSEWWMNQKFDSSGTRVRTDNLYGAVQWNFLTSYFPQKISAGMTVLDIGCGTGVYTNLMAKSGATAMGIDPSDKYLRVARENAIPGTRFSEVEIGAEGSLDFIPPESIDLIFICDALLFYFIPMFCETPQDINCLLSGIKRILKPNGVFICLEPHSAFFLCPWLGSPERPFTIVHEYLHKNFGIVPPLSQIMKVMNEHDFLLQNYQEIGPAESFRKNDSRAYHFAREFPIWHLLELKKDK